MNYKKVAREIRENLKETGRVRYEFENGDVVVVVPHMIYKGVNEIRYYKEDELVSSDALYENDNLSEMLENEGMGK